MLMKLVKLHPPEGHFSCLGKKSNQKKPTQGRRWNVKSISLPTMSFPVTPISSRPPLRTPPGRFASVKSSGIDFADIVVFIYNCFKPIA